jgi:hypothetical protein
MAGEIINRLNVGHVVNVKLTDSAVTNGQNLVEAYNYAKTLTPNGAALSATNRVSVIIQPGNYTLAAELAVNTQFVDLIGLGAIKLERGAVPAVIIGGNTLNVTANDVRVQGISVGSQAFKSGNNLPSQIFEDCVGGTSSFASLNNASGTFINCISNGVDGFGGLGTASGTFINCTATGSTSFGGTTISGTFINCTATGSQCFGGNSSTVSGTFINCTATNITSFGGFGSTVSGTFINCTATSTLCFGAEGTITGKFYQCRLAGSGDNFGIVTGTGLMRNCINGNNDIVDQ